MKRAYISTAIIVFLIIASVINLYVVKNIADDIKENLIITEESYDKETLDTAYEIFKRTHSYLCATISHTDVDGLRMSFVKAKTYLELEDYDDFKAEIETLLSSVEHIKEDERFIWGNIF